MNDLLKQFDNCVYNQLCMSYSHSIESNKKIFFSNFRDREYAEIEGDDNPQVVVDEH